MQKVPGRALAVLAALLAALAMILPAQARAVTLDGPLLTTPVCLSASSAPCNGSPALSGVSEFDFDFDLSGVGDLGEVITGATLLLLLSDDFGHGDGAEKINLVVGGVNVLHNADAGHDALIALPDLLVPEDGLLPVELTASGDFFFGGSTLTLSVEAGDDGGAGTPGGSPPTADQAVPAPAPLLLLGLGTAVLAWRRRARS
jgi:hypothetical protein